MSFGPKLDSLLGGVKRDLELMPCIGRGRYAAEHWIHSHPSIAACDLYKDPGYVWNYKGVPSHDFEKELRAAPRFDLAAYKIEGQCPHGDIWGLNLDDRLVEYQSLYGEQPSESWWGWKTYNTPFFIFTNANAGKQELGSWIRSFQKFIWKIKLRDALK